MPRCEPASPDRVESSFRRFPLKLKSTTGLDVQCSEKPSSSPSSSAMVAPASEGGEGAARRLRLTPAGDNCGTSRSDPLKLEPKCIEGKFGGVYSRSELLTRRRGGERGKLSVDPG